MRIKLSAALAAGILGLISTANATDLPVKSRAPVAAAVVAAPTWTGWYFGIMGGYGTGKMRGEPTGVLQTIGAYPVEFTADGGFAGAQYGYDYQYANGTVLGLVIDAAWAHLNGKTCADLSGACNFSNATFAIGTVEWLTTLRVRAGTTALGPNTLLYATGGLAVGGVKSEITFIDAVHNAVDRTIHVGWAAGGGAEFKVTQQVSLGLEYLYVDLGKKESNFNDDHIDLGIGGAITSESKVRQHLVKGALNFRY